MGGGVNQRAAVIIWDSIYLFISPQEQIAEEHKQLSSLIFCIKSIKHAIINPCVSMTHAAVDNSGC